MHNVTPRKKESKVLVITLDPFARRGRFANLGKAGRHKDKRRKAKVHQRAEVRRDT